MFEIEYKGGNSVVVTTKKSTLVVDPKLSHLGLKDVQVKNAVEVVTEPRLSLEYKDARLVFDGPGEYEIGDFSLKGIAATRHIDTSADEKIATIYRLELSGLRIAIIGNVTPKLIEGQLEEIGVIDIVILPVGGGGLTLDATSAASMVRQIDPKIIIPTHYAVAGVTYEMPQDNLETFVKELGAPLETVAKLKIKSAAALPSVMTIIEVNRS